MKILDLFDDAVCPNDQIRRPYIIAEAGVNHEGDIGLARRLIEEAAEGGAHAIKFQTYKAHTIASKDSPSYWDTRKEPTVSQYKLFQKYDKFWKREYEQLEKHCKQVGIEFLSTPFDVESAKFLNEMMDVFKISSSDITNKPFIEFLCDFNKPIILSTGASNLNEVQAAVDWIDRKKVPVVLLHCVLNYPTKNEDANLGMIKGLRRKFPDKLIGYSDHTLPGNMRVLEMAALLGSSVLEKHFTHDKTLPGNDHYHAMDKADLMLFHENLTKMFEMLGDENKYALDKEEPARLNARRSLVAAKNISQGEIISQDHLTWKRPAYGVPPYQISEVVGRRSLKKIPEDTVIDWSMLS